MFDSQTENFHNDMLAKLLQLSPADQALLIVNVRKNREERTKEELKIIAENEKKLKERFKHSHMFRYIEQGYEYEASSTFKHNVREKLLKCLHYKCFEQREEQDCSICAFEFKIGCKMVMLGCQHHFHIQCIEKWFLNKISCPLCRDTLVKSSQTQKIKDIEAQIKKLNVSRAAIVNRNKNTNDLLQSAFLSKLKPGPLPA